jgi:hypothetical protein
VTRAHPTPAWLLESLIGCALLAACARPSEEPRCRPVPPTILMAESVPTARLVPCVADLPDGWAVDAFSADDSTGTFTLAHEDGASLRVALRASCIPADDPVGGEARTDGVTQRMSTLEHGDIRWTSIFPGGCVVETLVLPSATTAESVSVIHQAIDLMTRQELDRQAALG